MIVHMIYINSSSYIVHNLILHVYILLCFIYRHLIAYPTKLSYRIPNQVVIFSNQALYLCELYHYSDVIMSVMTSKINGVSIVYSHFCSGTDQRKHHIKAPHHWPLLGEPPETGGFHSQRANNAENASI